MTFESVSNIFRNSESSLTIAMKILTAKAGEANIWSEEVRPFPKSSKGSYNKHCRLDLVRLAAGALTNHTVLTFKVLKTLSLWLGN